MQVVRIRLNREHIADAEFTSSQNPLLSAITEATGCQWYMTECGSGLEASPPHRQFLLQGDILDLWRLFRVTGEIAPCVFYLGLREFPQPAGPLPDTSSPEAHQGDFSPVAPSEAPESVDNNPLI